MKIAIKTSTCALLAACLLLCTSAAAQAEYYVPPSNSAVNQYTQSIPSAGGDKSGEGKGVTEAEAIGASNAKKLHKQGPDGTAAAELAAETAPTPVETDSSEEAAPAPSGEAGKKKHKKAKHHAKKPQKNGGEKEAKPAGGGGSTSGPSNGAGGSASAQGASASGELVSQATGLSGGTLGLFLPLVIIAAIVWSGIYLWRRRRGLDHSAA